MDVLKLLLSFRSCSVSLLFLCQYTRPCCWNTRCKYHCCKRTSDCIVRQGFLPRLYSSSVAPSCHLNHLYTKTDSFLFVEVRPQFTAVTALRIITTSHKTSHHFVPRINLRLILPSTPAATLPTWTSPSKILAENMVKNITSKCSQGYSLVHASVSIPVLHRLGIYYCYSYTNICRYSPKLLRLRPPCRLCTMYIRCLLTQLSTCDR